MKISNIRTKIEGDKISILADCKIRPVGTDTMFFSFDKKYADWIYEDASPFAATLLAHAMHIGEDLIIEGAISKKLYDGMYHIMETILRWQIEKPEDVTIPFHRIKIGADKLVEDSGASQKVGTFFSGGVDSFYTFLKHRNDQIDPITHLILVNGNDIDPRNHKLWETTRANVSAVAKEAGVEVIEVETNIQPLLEPMTTPDWTHGGTLGAIGLCLRKVLKKIYIPSTFSFEQNIPWGSHPETDNYWSSEKLAFEHDGIEADRLQKVELQISKSPLALKYLRVCNKNIKDTYNCGKCEKCVRTMVSLYAVGKLDEAKTFPNKIDYELLTHLIATSGAGFWGHQDNLSFLEEKNIDPRLQKAIKDGITNAIEPKDAVKERIIYQMIRLDHMYLRGKLFKAWLSIVHPY